MEKATVSNLLNALKTGNRKISARPNYIPPKYLAYIKTEVDSVNREINIVEMIETIDAEFAKQKWIEAAQSGRFSNPEFRYNEARLKEVASFEPKVLELFDLVYDYSPGDLREQFEVEMLLYTLHDLLLSIEIAKSMLANDDKATARFVRKKFGDVPYLTKNLCFEKEAEALEIKEREFDANEIKNAFELAQGRYGFSWPIEISDKAVAIDVRDKSSEGRRIVIPKARVVNSRQLLRLIGHEIESHERTSQNGVISFGFGGSSMKTDNEELYEGLALLSDRDFDLWEKGQYRNEAAIYYVRAIKMAMSGKSFAEVAQNLWQQRRHENNALNKAYNMTKRIFRGITDTTNPAGYAFTKDLAYYNGLSQAIELENRGLSWLLELGSFDLNQLIIIARYFRLSPQMIPYKRIDLKTDERFLSDLGLI